MKATAEFPAMEAVLGGKLPKLDVLLRYVAINILYSRFHQLEKGTPPAHMLLRWRDTEATATQMNVPCSRLLMIHTRSRSTFLCTSCTFAAASWHCRVSGCVDLD